jgi:uncharacterized protein YggE
MKLRFSALFLLVLGFVSIASAQGIQINKENRTISVAASDTMEVEPEIAVIQIGYHNYGPTQNAAYSNSGQISGKVIQSLLAAGLDKDAIETQAVRLETVFQPDKDWTPDQRKDRQFQADQVWTIRVAVADAGKIVDSAIAGGANAITSVNWTVADPASLDARVNEAAVTKARALAAAMATKLGAKVGELLYASNSNPPNTGEIRGFGTGSGYAAGGSAGRPSMKPVILPLPQKVPREATVYAVFALE